MTTPAKPRTRPDARGVPCDAFVDGGETRQMAGAAHRVERVCGTCRWSERAHTDEVRSILRGEHAESMRLPDGSFARRPKFTSPGGTR